VVTRHFAKQAAISVKPTTIAYKINNAHERIFGIKHSCPQGLAPGVSRRQRQSVASPAITSSSPM
jgi:hypothetical protein